MKKKNKSMVRQFRSDDPSTYLTNLEQQKALLLETIDMEIENNNKKKKDINLNFNDNNKLTFRGDEKAYRDHFVQSKVKQISIIKKMIDEETESYPIYIIHDAIIVDVSKYSYEKIKDICSEGFFIDKLNCEFPVKIEIIKE